MPHIPFRIVMFVLLGAFLTACAAMPGLHHALAPRLSGLSPVAPGVWADDRQAVAPVLALLPQARALVADFHGQAPMPDRLVLCATDACAARLGLNGPVGLNVGDSLVVIGPGGLGLSVLTHELAHVALHAGNRGARFPTWFDEGLAMHLAPPDPRYRVPDSLQGALWVRQARTLRDWNRMVGPDTYPDVYGAAGRVVAGIEAQVGREALRDFVQTVQAGANFDRALAAQRITLDP